MSGKKRKRMVPCEIADASGLHITLVGTDRLRPWEHSPRRDEGAVQAVERSIRQFGFNVPILCDEEHRIIAGHVRWKAAQRLQIPEVPVIELTLAGPERAAFAIADNKTAQIAEWNLPKLREVLHELEQEDYCLQNLGFTEMELREILGAGSMEDRIPETPRELRMHCGELLSIGPHRLLCADSSDRASLDRLAGDAPVDAVFAGPPCLNQCGLGDWESYEAYSRDMRCVMHNCIAFLKPGGVVVWHIANESAARRNMIAHHSCYLEELGLEYLDVIAWKKPCGGPDFLGHRIRLICVAKEDGHEQGSVEESGSVGSKGAVECAA